MLFLLYHMFEGSVIPYGRKTVEAKTTNKIAFEGSVIPYGRKTFEFDTRS